MTPKQERFCQEIVKGKSQADAYRVAYKPRTKSKKTIHEAASRIMADGKVAARVQELRAPVIEAVQWSLADRMKELSYAGRLDPADLVDEHNRPLPIREMPERARRALAGIEVDPDTFVTKLKFVDKRGATMDYSKLAGDMPKEQLEIKGEITLQALILAAIGQVQK